jgi:metal-sulfur cluster biosynthetic enzyme
LTELEDKVREAVGKVVDPETGLSFAEMRMIANFKEEPSIVKVDFIPSSVRATLLHLPQEQEWMKKDQ